MTAPVVSVIVPAWNSARTIAATLDSVAAQTLQPLEVVVTDDGSSDGTAAIARSFAGRLPRLRVLQQSRRGPSAARNVAIASCSGEFVAPIDSDDVWKPRYLAAHLDALIRAPDAGFSYCPHELIDEAGTRIRGPLAFNLQGGLFGPMLLTNMVGNGSCAVFRKSAMEEAGCYSSPLADWVGAEDYAMQLRIAARHPVIAVNQCLASYRMRSGSLSDAGDQVRKARIAAVDQALREFGPCPLQVERWTRGDASRVLAVDAIRKGHWPRAISLGIHALRQDPVGTGVDLCLRLANLAERLVFRQEPAPKIDPLTFWRLRRLHRGFPFPHSVRPASPRAATDRQARTMSSRASPRSGRPSAG